MSCVRVFCAVLLLGSFAYLAAAGTTVRRGTIESISADGTRLKIKFNHSDSITDVPLVSQVNISLDNKPADVKALKPGMALTIQVNSDGEGERILAKSTVDQPPVSSDRKPKSKSTKTTALRKSAKSSSRTSKKKMDNKGGLPDLKTGPFDTSAPAEAKSNPFPAANKVTPFPAGNGTMPAGNKIDSFPAANKTTPFIESEKLGAQRPSRIDVGGTASWPGFLGPNHDNISQESGLLRAWPPKGPRPAWHTTGLGQGYSTVSVVDGKVFTMGTPENTESVLAIDLETGKPLWSVPTGGPVFRDEMGNGPRGTPTISNGRAYALGASGDLVCVDIKTRSLVWHKNIAQEFGAPVPHWGFSESVLIDGPKLICSPGGQLATVVAFDKESGNVAWKTLLPSLPRATYASIIPADVGGSREYVAFLSQGVGGFRADNGQFLWANDAAVNQNAICSTPLFVKGNVFAASDYGVGGALISLSASDQGVQANLVYKTPAMKNHHGGLVAIGSYIYGADDQILTCISLENGRKVWWNRSVGKSSLTYADGHLYVRSENGPVALVEATPDAYRESGRFVPPRNASGPTWSYPVVAAGRLFLRDQDDLLCYWVRAGGSSP